MRVPFRFLVFLAVTAGVVACSTGDGEKVVGPASLATSPGDSGRAPGVDTGRPPGVDTTRVDSTRPPVPAKVNVSGRILGISVVVPTAGSRDTMRFDPVARAQIRLMRNVLKNGAATQEFAGEFVSDEAGRYAIRNLPGGYYILYVDPPANSIYGRQWQYLAAHQPEVKVDVYLWKKP